MNARTKTDLNSALERSASSGEVAVAGFSQGTVSRTPVPASAASGTMLLGRPAPLTLPFAPGDVISDKYQVIGLIGAGGVAFVVAALHLELGEMVALKFLRPESLAHPEIVERFASEARAAARIKSEHVCRVYDVGVLPDGAPFMVMEYLEGKDLSGLLEEQGRLPIKTAVDYVLQTCEALACAHAAGVVHRDIKPENLFVTRSAGRVAVLKVLDFGISKTALTARVDGERRFTKTMLPMGTPAYMSPEQIRSCGAVDARADVWALGCVLFELVTGTCAFDAPTLVQLGAAILERAPTPLRALVPEAPAELEAAILKCLEKDPSQRLQNVAELALAIYPFGPRRARISAERSGHILHSAGLGEAPVELASIGPPAPDFRPSVALPPVSEQPALTRNTVPASINLIEKPPNFRKRRMLPIFALGLALIGAGALALQVFSSNEIDVSNAAPAVPAQPLGMPPAMPVPAPSAAATPAAKPSTSTRPRVRDNVTTSSDQAATPDLNARAAARVRTVAVSPPKVRPVAPMRAKSAAEARSAPPQRDEEPDVGF